MIEFETLEELKQRVTPALKTKIKEIKSKNYNQISEEDIWNYLIKNNWKNAKDLTLYDIINDIINIEIEQVEEYRIKRSEQNDKN